ncbi:MAG TPA: serine/threonine-protein kinase [Gemmatimonadaceae bacterium]|nr:serine/threonine-protein kinase [Gemmatimonadaceae bacterium]
MTSLATPPDREFIDFQQAVAGRYSLERELGRGGMGIVYLAREVRLARPVAVKVLPRMLAASRPDLRERFVREAQMAAQLSHPNIVPIHHVDDAGEFVFFVMAFIDGQTLGERLRDGGPLPPPEAARIMRDVGWALAYAHLRGIVHRDIKPDNILLERATGRALVTDFGIAGDVQTPSTADGGYVRGTIHYLSPEQAAGAAVDGRSDLYSLGVTSYYALTGALPFDGPNVAAVMVAHATKRPTPIVQAAPHVPHRLADAVERCLEKQPELRWPTGEKFAEAVDAAFEMPKELPAPLRAWLAQGDRSRGLTFVVSVYGTSAVVALAAAGDLVLAGLAAGFIAALATLPTATRVRRLIAGGYGLDDLRAAVATNVARRREEYEYEAGSWLSLTPRRLGLISAASATIAAAMGTAVAFMPPGALRATWGGVLPGLTAMATVIAAIAGVGALVRLGQVGKLGWLGSPRLRFWKSGLGERLFRLAGVGVKRAAVSPSLPQHTEVALGRALETLFESLPKETRRELKDVPATVKRLEGEAQKLRDAIGTLDDAVAAAQRAQRPDDVAALERQRDEAAERLATTVTALETIRLGLLRLQIGAVPVATVTEAIAAATALGRELDIAAQARAEVSAVLRTSR